MTESSGLSKIAMTILRGLAFSLCLLVICSSSNAWSESSQFWVAAKSKSQRYFSKHSHLSGKGSLSFTRVAAEGSDVELNAGRVLAQIRRGDEKFQVQGIKTTVWGEEEAKVVSFSTENEHGEVSGRLVFRQVSGGDAACLILVALPEVYGEFEKYFELLVSGWDWDQSVDANVLYSD